MATFPTDGRIALAESLNLRPLHIAWGLGDGAWTTPPSESTDATGLINEIGRRVATSVGYAEPDEDGSIVTPDGGRFSESSTPTRHLYVQVQFDFNEASSAVIREVAVFAGTVVLPSVPSGQEYFEPDELQSPGRLVSIYNTAPIYRTSVVAQKFEIVITL